MILAVASIAVPVIHASLFRLANNAIRPPAANVLQIDGSADIAGVTLTTRFLDVAADRVQFLRELLDIFGSQVGIFLDIGDCHQFPLKF
jgi:hypothetical protein